ncbi:MAG: trypsin-like serine protease [Deltaproteobacteria bacterium]|nr:trypsin-like serine protease [Deltaproteobacteria bacterium]
MRIAAIVFALSLVACGPLDETASPNDTVTATAPIINGHTDTTDTNVASLLVGYPDGSGYLCSGSIIGPYTFLTAGHCTNKFNPLTDVGFIVLNNNSDRGLQDAFYPDGGFNSIDGGAVEVRFLIANPDFRQQTGNQDWNDIGLGFTSQPMPGPYLPLNRYPLDRLPLYGAPVTEVGFGETSPDGGGVGTRREVTKYDVKVRSAGELTSGAQAGLTCEGDSGGPALFKTPDGLMSVIGTTSRGDQQCAQSGIDTRVDAYLDFIRINMVDAGDPPSCGADGRCGFNCTAPDPDCPCAPDGFCTSACTTPEADPDCPQSCLYNGGSCAVQQGTTTGSTGSPSAADAGSKKGGGCSTASGSDLIWPLALVFGAVALSRSRRWTGGSRRR